MSQTHSPLPSYSSTTRLDFSTMPPLFVDRSFSTQNLKRKPFLIFAGVKMIGIRFSGGLNFCDFRDLSFCGPADLLCIFKKVKLFYNQDLGQFVYLSVMFFSEIVCLSDSLFRYEICFIECCHPCILIVIKLLQFLINLHPITFSISIVMHKSSIQFLVYLPWFPLFLAHAECPKPAGHSLTLTQPNLK